MERLQTTLKNALLTPNYTVHLKYGAAVTNMVTLADAVQVECNLQLGNLVFKCIVNRNNDRTSPICVRVERKVNVYFQILVIGYLKVIIGRIRFILQILIGDKECYQNPNAVQFYGLSLTMTVRIIMKKVAISSADFYYMSIDEMQTSGSNQGDFERIFTANLTFFFKEYFESVLVKEY